MERTRSRGRGRGRGTEFYATRGIQGVVNAQRAELKVAEERRALRQQAQLIWLGILAFIVVYIVLAYYSLRQNYGPFIDLVDQSGVPCSGLRTAACLRYPFLNSLWGCTQNNNVPAAMWYLAYTTGLRQAALAKFGGNQDQAINKALLAIYSAGFIDLEADAHALACAAVGNPLNAECAPRCPLQTNFGGSSMGVAVAEGAMNGAGIGMGLMVINPVVGAIAAGIGAIFGAVMGGIARKQEEAKTIQECQQGRQNCYLPANFPPCQGSA